MTSLWSFTLRKKAKIHMHEPKKAKIQGSNIHTVQRGPKIASAKINDTGKKEVLS